MSFIKRKFQILNWLALLILWSLTYFLIFNYVYHVETSAYRQQLAVKNTSVVNVSKEIIIKELESLSADVLILSQHSEWEKLSDAHSRSNLEYLTHELFFLSQIKRYFDQVRYLDEKGQEIIRINYDINGSKIVPANKLQNKAGRYYFEDAFRLNKGEVFVSPFDLNIENGEIEQPLKPMIRFATPVFDKKSKKRGIVLVNYLGSTLLNNLKQRFEKAMLLNSDGYWLSSPNSAQEWGFMFGTDERFDLLHPEAWKIIQAEASGQFFNDNGLFTYNTVYPIKEGVLSSNGTHEPFMPSNYMIKGKQYYWKTVTHIPAETLAQGESQIRNRLLLQFLPLYFVI